MSLEIMALDDREFGWNDDFSFYSLVIYHLQMRDVYAIKFNLWEMHAD